MQAALRALANWRRVRILGWLKDPHAHFSRQVGGDLPPLSWTPGKDSR